MLMQCLFHSMMFSLVCWDVATKHMKEATNFPPYLRSFFMSLSIGSVRKTPAHGVSIPVISGESQCRCNSFPRIGRFRPKCFLLIADVVFRYHYLRYRGSKTSCAQKIASSYALLADIALKSQG